MRSFAIAARTGNLGRAARQLNLTAAAVSQQLHKLEETLAAQLLIRHSRGVCATPAGRELLRRADTILHLLGTPLAGAPSAGTSEATVSITLPAEFGPLLAAPLMAAAQERHPEAIVELAESSDDALEAIYAGEADIALLQDPPKLDDIQIDRVLTEDLGIVIAPSHKLAESSQPLRLRELLAVPLILPNSRHWIRRLLAKAEAQRGIRCDAVMQVDSLPMILAMVRHGLGGTVLPAAALRDQIAVGALVFRPLTQPAIAVAHAVAVQRSGATAVHAFACTAAEIIRSAAASGAWPGARLVRAAPQAAPPEPRRDVLAAPLPLGALSGLGRSPACVEGD